MNKLQRFCFYVCALAVFPLGITAAAQTATQPAPAAKPAPAYESDPKFTTAWNEGRSLDHEHRYVFALDAYKKANKIAGGSCVKCLDQIQQLQSAIGQTKEAVATAQTLVSLAITARDKSIYEGELGQALLAKAGAKPKPEQLQAAQEVLQTAVNDYPPNNGARWQNACTLARMGRMDDAKQEFTACAQRAGSTDPMRVRAAHFAENPELSLHKMAPAFEVTALDGTKFNLDNMGGKVVLVDFWATWCGPCNEELPNVKKIAKEFAGQPFVLISVSWDSDETKWTQFIQKNEMTWLQYRDADHKLSEEFGINAIPHYFTIDSDGVLTAEILGSGNDVEGKIKKLIKRAQATQVSAQVAAQGSND